MFGNGGNRSGGRDEMQSMHMGFPGFGGCVRQRERESTKERHRARKRERKIVCVYERDFSRIRRVCLLTCVLHVYIMFMVDMQIRVSRVIGSRPTTYFHICLDCILCVLILYLHSCPQSKSLVDLYIHMHRYIHEFTCMYIYIDRLIYRDRYRYRYSYTYMYI